MEGRLFGLGVGALREGWSAKLAGRWFEFFFYLLLEKDVTRRRRIALLIMIWRKRSKTVEK